jgi:hypothetical protein
MAANTRLAKANRHLDEANAAFAQAEPPLPEIAALALLDTIAPIEPGSEAALAAEERADE